MSALTPEQRARLVEVMARDIYASRFPGADVADHFEWHARGLSTPGSCVHYSTVAEVIRYASAAIAAAERAGFLIVAPGARIAKVV